MRLTEGQFFGESALKEVNIGGGGRGGLGGVAEGYEAVRWFVFSAGV